MDEVNNKIKEAIKGKQKAYEFLLSRFWDDIYRFQLSMTKNQIDAEDITIQTFAKAFDNLEQFNAKFSFKNWLIMISKQVYIDYQRKKKQQFVSIDRNSDEVSQLKDNELTAEDKIILEQKLLQLKKAIKQLKPHYKEVIELRYFNDLSNKEIAERLGDSVNNVKIKLMRARRLLSGILSK